MFAKFKTYLTTVHKDGLEAQYRSVFRFAAVLTFLTLLLIGWGGSVNATNSGLSVPDWPTTYDQNMFTYPPSLWKGPIFFEHSHRLLASVVGLLTIVLAIRVHLVEKAGQNRTWMIICGWASLAAVSIQGILGGLTVLYQLPTEISVSHGMLAQLFLFTLLIMTSALSAQWRNAKQADTSISSRLKRLTQVTFIFSIIQVLLGALTRHTYSGLALPEFPEPLWLDPSFYSNTSILLHYLHRVWAVVLSVLMIWQTWLVVRNGVERLKQPAVIAMVLLVLQITLGAFIVWTLRGAVPNVLHTMVGASILCLNGLMYARALHFSQPRVYENTVPTPKAVTSA